MTIKKRDDPHGEVRFMDGVKTVLFSLAVIFGFLLIGGVIGKLIGGKL